MLEHIINGKIMMIPLIICSLISLAVVYDRWFAFRENRRIDTRSLRTKVLNHLRAGNVDAAEEECIAAEGPVAAVLLAAVRSYGKLKEKGESAETMRLVIGEVMDDYSAQSMSVVNKRLDVLTTIGTAAPLLGMTGTVTGMIASFGGLADGGDNSAVANGIAEAMITTAAGLIIALFAVIPQSVFNRWSDEIELEIEEANSELVELILTQH
ncbi:MAG: MotA/TolQ/ExbB proton channel family protein [Akkermansiaceae bacterium]|nr:MotA/TolQ/ExbB proton channel family protein [Akkermansiaceae bacterium]